MSEEELRNLPLLLFPTPPNEVYFADKDHVWINGRQYISLKRVGEMMKRMTNADLVRQMTDEELAEFLYNGCEPIPATECDKHGGCKDCWLDWLKQEVTE